MQRTERGTLEFYGASLRHLVSSKVHSALRRERHHRIGGRVAVLPPGHRLPWFQSLFPSYDTFAEPLLRAVAEGKQRPLLIDVGANVGDTTLMAVGVVPGIQVRAVEGNPEFVHYLRANTSHLGGQVETIDRFVSVPTDQPLAYSHTGSTGGFRTAEAAGEGYGVVTVEQLLDGTDAHDLTIWKSDTDGLDIAILLREWKRIEPACEVIWFELDPFLDVEHGSRLPELCERIRASGRVLHVVDNTGRAMMTVPSSVAADVLLGLTSWASEAAVPGDTSYFDVWLLDPSLTHRDPVSGLLAVGPAQSASPGDGA